MAVRPSRSRSVDSPRPNGDPLHNVPSSLAFEFMLSLLLGLFPISAGPIAQAAPIQQIEPDTPGNREVAEDEVLPPQPIQRREVIQPSDIRKLPGRLDSVPVFNSNSPEVVLTEGILLSTFPPNGMADPSAHLNYPMQGRFDIFSHHISRASASQEGRTLFQGVMVYNPGPRTVEVSVNEAASYISRFDAPFKPLPAYVEDPIGAVYSGSGSRVVGDVLRGRRRGGWRQQLRLAPRQAEMLMNANIPVGKITPSSNTRSTLIRAESTGPVYLASLAMFSPKTPDGREQIPQLRDWQLLLVRGRLSGPRDVAPTSPGLAATASRFFYGRVAGVARGSSWDATLTDPGVNELRVPPPGMGISYPIATLPRGTFGTNQVQSAPMLVRYLDTAYAAHGNYGVQYNLTLPLANRTNATKQVAVLFQTPLKDDVPRGGLRFLEPPEERVFFRGPIRLQYLDDEGNLRDRFVHVVQHRGEQGQPLMTLNLRPGTKRSVQVSFLYPPDATPPQVLTVQTLP